MKVLIFSLFFISFFAQADYSKLSFPSSQRFSFIPGVIGMDHNHTPASNRIFCTNFEGKRNFPYCYGGHRGSDYMLVGGFFAMHAGVNVRAAAKGKVVHVEDGHGDHCFGNPFTKNPMKITCLDNPTMEANYIVVEQEDGLFAFYFHLRKNSTKVHVGDEVNCGTNLAQVGSSGISSSPHIHFELRKRLNNDPINRFTYNDLFWLTETIDPYSLKLWKKLVGRKPQYQCE